MHLTTNLTQGSALSIFTAFNESLVNEWTIGIGIPERFQFWIRSRHVFHTTTFKNVLHHPNPNPNQA